MTAPTADRLLSQVRAALASFDSLDPQAMIDHIARERGEAVILLDGPAKPAGPTAYWVRAAAADGTTTNYLIVDGELSPRLYQRSVLHELGHMYFGDPAVGDPEPTDLAGLGVPTQGTVMRRRGCSNDTADPAGLEREKRVELFAILASAPAAADDAPLPPGVRRLLDTLEAGG